MKIFHIAAALIITATLGASSARAQILDGKYGGEGVGTDANGTVLHQVTKWTFKHGKMTSFEELISFPGNTSIAVCDFLPNVPPPFPYSTGAPDNSPTIMIGFGCPNPSANERPEAFVIIPERDGREFSYLVYSVFSSDAFDLDTPAHFSGHAIIRTIR